VKPPQPSSAHPANRPTGTGVLDDDKLKQLTRSLHASGGSSVLDELTEEDRASLLNVLDALVAKTRMKALTASIS